MSIDRMDQPNEEVSCEVLHRARREKPDRRRESVRDIVGPWSYRAKIGKGTIRLSAIEYRIFELLASRPYHAFSRRKIVQTISTDFHPVSVERLGHYIQSLRRQLGFYGNYIQSVPYIGYRFKA